MYSAVEHGTCTSILGWCLQNNVPFVLNSRVYIYCVVREHNRVDNVGNNTKKQNNDGTQCDMHVMTVEINFLWYICASKKKEE